MKGEKRGWSGHLGPSHRALPIILRNRDTWQLEGTLAGTWSFRTLGTAKVFP